MNPGSHIVLLLGTAPKYWSEDHYHSQGTLGLQLHPARNQQADRHLSARRDRHAMSGSRVCVKWSRAVSRFVIDCAQCVWEKGREGRTWCIGRTNDNLFFIQCTPEPRPSVYCEQNTYECASASVYKSAIGIFLHEQWAIARDIRSEAILSVGGNSPNECLQHSIYDLVGKSTHAKI